jgi:ribonuclease P protein component
MLRLKTRPQFQAALAGKTLSKTAHFVLHGCPLPQPPSGEKPEGTERAQALFSCVDVWLGAMVPKRWAKRAATRNLIKRQIYTISSEYQHVLTQGAHVVRLRSGWSVQNFPSASSDALQRAVRQELLQLFASPARMHPPASGVAA